jgi:hypothetical protein
MMGIDPDVLIGFRRTDGQRRKALRVAGVLPQGIALAVRQCWQSSCREAQTGAAPPATLSSH